MVGMTCGRCVNYIQTKMGEVEGVVETVVSLEDAEAMVTYDTKVMDSTAVAEAVDKVGSKFTARLISEVGLDAVQHCMVPQVTEIHIEGMSCQSCVRNITGRLDEQEGVLAAEVNLEEKKARVEFDPLLTNPDTLVSTVNKMGTKFTAFLETSTVTIPMDEEDDEEDKNMEDSEAEYEKCWLRVEGMTCASCVASIERHGAKLEGVKSILVALMAAKAEVDYNPSRTSPSRIAEAISSLGFPTTVLENKLTKGEVEISIKGMTCSSCVHLIESSLLKMPGISAASVALSTEKGKVSFDPSSMGPRDVVEAVNSLGFTASLISREMGQGIPDHQEDIR